MSSAFTVRSTQEIAPKNHACYLDLFKSLVTGQKDSKSPKDQGAHFSNGKKPLLGLGTAPDPRLGCGGGLHLGD